MEKKRMFSVGQVAEMFSVSTSTVRKWGYDGLLIADEVTDRQHRRYSEETIREFIKKHQIEKGEM